MNQYGKELFKGAAQYYSKYRPMYPPSLIRYLIRKFSLNGEQQLLDLGCGTGQLTMRFSDWCRKIVGIDLEREMLVEAKRLQNEMRVNNIHWYEGNLEKYKTETNEKFNLVIIAKAFHWMDRVQVLDELYELVTDNGGVAIIDHYEPNKKPTRWQEQLNQVIEKWYSKERRAGKTIYSHPSISHEEILANSKFKLEIEHLPPFEITWTIDAILGNHYSTSFGSKRFLGDHVEAFENEVKETLLAINKTGVF